MGESGRTMAALIRGRDLEEVPHDESPRRAAPMRLLALIGAVIVLGGVVAPVTA